MTGRTPLMLGLLLASLVIGAILLREPVFGPYFDRKAEIVDLRREVAALTEKLAETKAAARSRDVVWSGYGEPLGTDEKVTRNGAWMRRVEAIANGAGLEVATIQPRRERLDESGVVAFPLSVSLTGDTGGLVKFLSQLASLRGVVEVERLVIRRQGRETQPLSIQASVANYGVVDAEQRAALARAAAEAARKKSS